MNSENLLTKEAFNESLNAIRSSISSLVSDEKRILGSDGYVPPIKESSNVDTQFIAQIWDLNDVAFIPTRDTYIGESRTYIMSRIHLNTELTSLESALPSRTVIDGQDVIVGQVDDSVKATFILAAQSSQRVVRWVMSQMQVTNEIDARSFIKFLGESSEMTDQVNFWTCIRKGFEFTHAAIKDRDGTVQDRIRDIKRKDRQR